MNDMDDILRSTQSSVERAEMEELIRKTLKEKGGTGGTPMRPICLDKVMAVIEEKMSHSYKVINLETDNMILNLRSEIKKDVGQAIKEAINTVKERTNWGIEMVKFAVTLGSAIAAVKISGI